MARLAWERALPASWMDDVSEAHRRRQYSRDLLFLTVVELIALVSPRLRPHPLLASGKRLAPLVRVPGCGPAGAGLVVHDPDVGLVTDLVACEDAHASERAAVAPC